MNKFSQSSLVKPAQTRKRRGPGSSQVYLESGEIWGTASGRVYVKRQHAYTCRPIWRLFLKTPTLRREVRALACCRQLGIRVPRVVLYREEGEYAQLVVEEIDGALPLDRALNEPGADRVAIVANVASVIGSLHGAGWSHGALYPDHILVGLGPDYKVTLIDLEKARQSRFNRRVDLNRFWRYHTMLNSREIYAFKNHYYAMLALITPIIKREADHA